MTNDANWFDPDIEKLVLRSDEKAGLQVYRNYTRSFEKHAIGKFREALNDEKLDLSDFQKVADLVVREDLRFVPIILCAFADDILLEAFKAAIPDGVPGGKGRLFSGYGPLSDLSKRIKMAFAFDVFSADLMVDLDRLRETRNEISHSWDSGKLGEFYVSGRVADLFPVEVVLAEQSTNEPILGTVLDAAAAFRVRVIWLAGRLRYEASFYGRAKQARLSPMQALYADGGTKWLTKVAGICTDATRAVIRTTVG